MPLGETCETFAALVTTTSAEVDAATSVRTLAVLLVRFGSLVPDEIEAVFRICVPLGVAAGTPVTTVNVPDEEPATSGSVQVIRPVEPTGGVVQAQPVGAEIEVNVVFCEIFSEKTAFTASVVLLLVTTCV